MSIEVDILMDRRRLKRRLAFWRILAVIAVVACVIVGVARAGVGFGGAHVARLTVDGVITGDRPLVDAIAAVGSDASAKALIVDIDSPGGSVTGGEALYDAIRRVAQRKPVVAVMGGEAASAGYMIAMPAERVFANGSTLTGSIGVFIETPDVSVLLGRLGIGVDAVVSGPLKDQPSIVKPLSPEGRDVLQGIVNNIYQQFVNIVAAGRHMPADRVRQLADGRPYTGEQALQLGLIDQIGDETDARAWLETAHRVSAALPVRDVAVRGRLAQAIGASLGAVFVESMKSMALQGLKLDGLWALWQPSRS